MKVLLQEIRTGRYYQDEREWTAEKAKAFNIGQIPRAVTLALEARLEHAEILLCYDEPRFDLALPFELGIGTEATPGASEPTQRLPSEARN